MPSQFFRVKAVYEYSSQHEDDLHFPEGQIIDVINEEDDEWYSGEYVDESGIKREGIFPKTFVEKYEPEAPPLPDRTYRPSYNSESRSASLESLPRDTESQPITVQPEADQVYKTSPSEEFIPPETSLKTISDSPPVNQSHVATSSQESKPQISSPKTSVSGSPPDNQSLVNPPSQEPNLQKSSSKTSVSDSPPVNQSLVNPPSQEPKPQESSPKTLVSGSPPVNEPQVTPPSQESKIQKSSPKTPASSSPLANQTPKFSRSSPSRTSSFEKPSPPHVFEKPVSNSFKDRVAAFNKASSSIPGPLRPGGLASRDSSLFIKKQFIAPPPSKNAYIPLPKDHSIPSKIALREVDQGLAKNEFEKNGKNEKSSIEPIALKELVNTEIKPTSLKERIALLQKQQMEQAARHTDVAHKKEKAKRPSKKYTESILQIESSDQKKIVEAEEVDSKEVSSETIHEENKKIISSGSKLPKTEEIPHPRTPRDENKLNESQSGQATIDTEESHNSPKNSTFDKDTIPLPQYSNTKSKNFEELRDEEEDHDDDEDENEEEEDDDDDDEITAEIRRKEELRARMAKMSGGMSMHGIFGPPGGISIPSLIVPKKKSNNTIRVNESKENSPVITPKKEFIPPIPLPGMAQIKHEDEQNDKVGNSDLATTSSQASPKVEKIDSIHKQVTSLQDLSTNDTRSPSLPSPPPP